MLSMQNNRLKRSLYSLIVIQRSEVPKGPKGPNANGTI